MPPIAQRAVSDSDPSTGAKAGLPSFQSETCRCIEQPDWPLNGLAMKVATTPWRRQTSRMPYFMRNAWSAAQIGSPWLRFTSHCAGPYSTFEPSTSTNPRRPSSSSLKAGSRSLALDSE